MYAVYADNVCIYDDTAPDKQHMAVSPKLTLSAGAAGSLSLTLPVGCDGYTSIQRLTTTLRVERDGEVIWKGRCLSETRDLYNSRQLFCEGALAYLNDTIPMVANPTLSSVLTAHNAKVAADRQIAAGTAAYGGVTADADGSTSLDIINSKLVGALGGVLRMRYPSGTPTLDWLSNYPAVTGNEQSLEFGENLLDFTRSWDMNDFATYCYVRGHKDEDTEVYAASGWVTLSGDPAPATLYGRIEKYLDYSDLETDAQCISAAQTYLATQQFAEMTLEVTALDLHILNPAVKSFDLLERVHVSSWAHGLDADFAVTGMDIPLDDPGNTKYTLGFVNVAYVRRVNTLTQKTRQEVQETAEEAKSYTDEGVTDAKKHADEAAAAAQEAAEQTAAEALQEAKQEIDATMSSLTEGYIFIDTNGTNTQGIYITNSPIHAVSEITSGMKVWKWSMTGLGFSDDGGSTWRTAMTYDGKINADMILTGLLMAQYIKLYGDMAVYNASGANIPSGYLGCGAGHNGYNITDGIHMYIGNNEVIVTDYGVRISCGSNQIYVDGNSANVTCELDVDGNVYVRGNIYASGAVVPGAVF